MLGELLALVDHPATLLAAAGLSLPALWPIGRFLFGDFATFKAEVGFATHTHRALWRRGFLPVNPSLYFKLAGLIGAYAAVVAAVYQLLVRLAR